jgi:outer membrane lipoprotein-sorting protein
MLFLFPNQGPAGADPSEQILNAWLKKQAQVKSWSADVLQTRKLKTLVRPLETLGRVWFAPPNRFRWQLGDPPRTIAIQTEEDLVIVYPRLKQVERYPRADITDPSWGQVLALLELGFPSDAENFYARYELISATRSEKIWQFDLQPAAKEARRLLERVRLEISADDLVLSATELVFPDGSTMRNQFSGHRLNSEIDESLFEIQMDAEYQVVYPLKQKK